MSHLANAYRNRLPQDIDYDAGFARSFDVDPRPGTYYMTLMKQSRRANFQDYFSLGYDVIPLE
jgi:hypothetical protein